jgi:hypothetical protein
VETPKATISLKAVPGVIVLDHLKMVGERVNAGLGLRLVSLSKFVGVGMRNELDPRYISSS